MLLWAGLPGPVEEKRILTRRIRQVTTLKRRLNEELVNPCVCFSLALSLAVSLARSLITDDDAPT